METYACEEYVGLIELSICKIKEIERAIWQGFQYKWYPKLMIQELQAGTISTMNMFQHKNGISHNKSPGNIVNGRTKADINVKKISFGSFACIHVETKNTMKPIACLL